MAALGFRLLSRSTRPAGALFRPSLVPCAPVSPPVARAPLGGRPSPRRIAIAIALAILVAAGVALVARASAGGGDGAGEAAAGTSAPLTGAPPLVAEPPPAARRLAGDARLAATRAAADASPEDVPTLLALVAQEQAAGDLAAARAALARAAQVAPADPRVEVARVVLGWPDAAPADAIERLQALAVGSEDPFLRMQIAVALLWGGRTREAETALREIRGAAPDDYYESAADDLLHPGLPNGYPPFLPASGAPSALAEAKALVERTPRDPAPLVAYGSALQADGDRPAAARAYADALALAPQDVDARVAQIVNGFDKDRPERAFGALGPLVRDTAGTPVPRFHLGMLLLWTGDRQTARREFARVAAEHPDAPLGQLAARLAEAPAAGATTAAP